ncbi:MAG: WD40 repeat domain-containing protein [Bacteroidales bacterium]|nr:WD40 repeat domain-containing protein [Bacteroidales bacterium]
MKCWVFILGGWLWGILFSQVQLKEITVSQQILSNVFFMESGGKAVVSSYDGKMYVLDLIKGVVEKSLDAHQSFVLAMAPNVKTKMIATAGWDKKIKIWDMQNMSLTKEILAHADKINALAFTSDGKYVVSGSEDFTAIVWDVAQGSKVYTFKDPKSSVTSVDIDPNDKYVALGSWDKKVYLYSLENGNLIRSYQGHQAAVNSVVFSPDAKYIVSCGDDNQVVVWNVDNNSRRFLFTTFSSPVMDAKFFLNGRFLFTVEKNGDFQVFDMNNGNSVSKKNISKNVIRKLYVFEPKSYILTAGSDGIVKLFNANEFKFYDCLRQKMDSFADLAKPKAEFETNDQYNKRIKEYERQKNLKIKDCEKEYEAMLKAQKEKEEQEILASYKYVFFPVKLGTYDATQNELPIEFNNLSYKVKITPEEAKTMKESQKNVQVRGIQRMNNKTLEIINYELIHPVTQKTYPAGPQVAPSQDKFLAKFLQQQQQTQSSKK